jgi:mono/diheme cytochrome c family protein
MFQLRKSSACLVGAVAVASAAGLSCKSEQHQFHACTTEAVTAYVDGVTKEKKALDFSEDRWCAPRTFAGGVTIEKSTLDAGHDAYMLYCYACHGENGDGKGPASFGLRPPPRNFTQGIFKFARMRSSDELPADEDLYRIVHGGLHGTAMLAWDIPEAELMMILQYVKTFAPQKWEKKKKNGEPVKTLEVAENPPDPWVGKDAESVSRGRDLYHFKAECVNCHPMYGAKDELYKLSVDANKREPDIFKPITGFRDDAYGSVAKDSSEYGVRILPPDFLFSEVRSVRAGSELEDLFRVISYGVYPIMPAWKGALEDKDIWAIAHYVKSLMDARDTPAAATMKAKFATQAAFEVPAPPKVEEKIPEPAPAASAAPSAAPAVDPKKPAH